MLLSLVVPVYREEKNVPEFLRRVRPVLSGITEDYEIIFALDPSPDRTEEAVLEERAKDLRIKLLKFSRRFGQPMATLGGLRYAGGDAVIVMDVDLQDPPELLAVMVARWREGNDVVLPQRRHRTGEPWIKRLIAATGYRIINRISEVPIPPNTGDFRLISRRVVDEVLKLRESHGFLRGMVAVVGFKQCLVPFDRPARFSGETNYNRFFRFAADRIQRDLLFFHRRPGIQHPNGIRRRRRFLPRGGRLLDHEAVRLPVSARQSDARHPRPFPRRRPVDQRRHPRRIHRPHL